jgi:uncharacterized protein YhfF
MGKKLNEVELQYWQKYLVTIPNANRPIDPTIEGSYAGNVDCTDKLLELYLTGKKTAGSSLAEDFISNGEPIPKVGNYWILLDSKNQPSCILRTERVVLNKFTAVPPEISVAEGEGDLTLEYWQKSHQKYFSPFLQDFGITDINEAIIVTEFFALIYK